MLNSDKKTDFEVIYYRFLAVDAQKNNIFAAN